MNVALVKLVGSFCVVVFSICSIFNICELAMKYTIFACFEMGHSDLVELTEFTLGLPVRYSKERFN